MQFSPILRTERLILRLPAVEDAAAVGDFYRRNWTHLEPWWPRMDTRSFDVEPRRIAIQHALKEFQTGTAVRFIITLKTAPNRMVGLANVNHIVAGVSQSGILGYGLDHLLEGQGIMKEALTAVIAYCFNELNLHRLEAHYVPQNERSGAVLKSLNFMPHGYARDYLLINGRWQDHILTYLVNPNWKSTP